MNQEITPMDKSIRLPEDDFADLQQACDANVPTASDGLAPIAPLPIGQMPDRKPFKRKPITTLTLTSRTCKWPFGDPAQSDFHYCGRPPQAGRPYCDEHDRMSYQPTRRKTP
jgi:GcrA cell cycle regulator